MKLISWNVNGIRAAQKKGFLDWLQKEGPDVICLQETKANIEQLDEELAHPKGYESFFYSAQKKGYSGVATFTRKKPKNVESGWGIEQFDNEGRVQTLEFDGFVLINAYFPNSSRDNSRLPYKLEFCGEMLKYCDSLVKKGKNIVLCGDYNIAHKEIDLKNPKTNHTTAGFLPEERAWMDQFIDQSGYVDVFRHFVKEPHHYTWWSYRPGVRARNIGWRIDYHCINPQFLDRVASVGHQPDVMGSDHCPVYLELKR